MVAKQAAASSRAASRGVAEGMSVPSSDADDGADVPTEFGTGGEAGASGAPDAPAWLQPLLRLLAETQHELATKGGSAKPRTPLASLRLENFRGGREITTHQYRAWKKQAQIVHKLYGLGDSEVKGRAKQLLDILEVSDLEKPTGLEMVWKILDRAHDRMEHERADDAYSAWETARRKPGQSIDQWATYLRKTKLKG